MSDTTETVYHETFLLYPDGPDGEPDYDADFTPRWACGICYIDLAETPEGVCPEHAPTERPGLFLVHCDATPRHPQLWMIENGTGDGPGCLYCIAKHDQQRIDHLEHARHHRWATHLNVHVLCALQRTGVIRSWHWRGGGACNGPKSCTVITWRWTR